MMRSHWICAATVVACLVATARAGFTFSTVTSDADTGNERVMLFALNNGNGTGTKALASDVTITDLSGHHLVTKFKSSAGRPDVSGVEAPDPYNSDRSFVNLLGDPSGGATGADNDPTAYNVVSFNPPYDATSVNNVWNEGLSQFEVVGANLAGGVGATAAANAGRGALIAVAVAPTGDAIGFGGSIGGDQGGPQPIPEPGAALLVAPLALLILRQLRAAH